ncbi:MAG: Fic family protein [bacterium]|jgi:Fic family protein
MSSWEQIDQKKKELDSLRPFPENTIRTLREKLILEWTYNSNAIEGNTLTMRETQVVLEGVTVGGKSIREHLEAINHRDAILYLEEIVQKQEPLTEWEIKNIHALVLKNIDPKNAGVYRNENVVIAGAKHIPPDFTQVPTQMQAMVRQYTQDWTALHPVERSSLLHLEFVKIHPFVDGNGRTARLLQNFELMKHGFPPIVIKKEHRLEYYDLLDLAHSNSESRGFITFTAQRVEEVLDLYLQLLKRN